jgi:hypothetical protein
VTQRGLALGQSTVYSGDYTADGQRIAFTDGARRTVDSFGLYEDRSVVQGAAYQLPSITRTPGLAARESGADRVFMQDRLGSTRLQADGTGSVRGWMR